MRVRGVLGSDFYSFDITMMSVRCLQKGSLRSFLGISPESHCKMKSFSLRGLIVVYDAI